MISFIEMHGFYFALLWIRDNLVTDLWIRILLFMQVADKMPTKNMFFSQSFFAYTSVFKDKKSKRSHKIVKSRFFLLFCMLMVFMVWYVDFYELFILWVGSSGGGEKITEYTE
jgi:hypothetical protein